MEKRYCQPSLLWALAQEWYLSQLDTTPRSAAIPVRPEDYRPHDLTLYIYRTDQEGAYMLSGPKLYYQDTPMSGDHFANIGQDDLADHVADTGEVVIYDRRLRKTVLIGSDIEAAVLRMRGQKVGRPAVGDESFGSITLPADLKTAMEKTAEARGITVAEARREAYRRYSQAQE